MGKSYTLAQIAKWVGGVVRGEADAALSATGGKGFILAAGCTIYPETPEENLRAAEAVRHKSKL